MGEQKKLGLYNLSGNFGMFTHLCHKNFFKTNINALLHISHKILEKYMLLGFKYAIQF